jgi:hypothetical protein
VKTLDRFKAAAEAAKAATDQHLQPVLWLLRVAPRSSRPAMAAADVLQRLVHLPHVPLHHAEELVAAGVRIPYAGLLSAASNMVAGVEVGVQAQQKVASSPDLPAATVAICCQEDWVSLYSNVSCWLKSVHSMLVRTSRDLELPSPVCNKLPTRLVLGYEMEL